MTMIADLFKAMLDEVSPRPALEGDALPVLVKVQRGVTYLGRARTAEQAELLGLERGISCNYISTACFPGDTRKFFVLH